LTSIRCVIRMTDTAARHREVADEVETRVLDVLRSGRWVGGPIVAEAEAAAARLFDRAGAVGVNSGTDALIFALHALGVRRGDEVIVPALTFFATAGAVASIGAIPVVADVGDDGCLDPVAAVRALTTRTRAVIPVHVFGNLAVAPQLGVPVLGDAAQAVGGTPARSVGDLIAISTYPTKTWGAAGDGGFVIGDDPELLGRARRLANHGMDGVPHHHELVDGLVGRNSRLDAIQAAVLVAQVPRLAARVARRRAIAARYDRELPPSFQPLRRDEGSPVHQYAVLHERRDIVRAALAEAGVETAIYYPLPLHRQPALAWIPPADCPVADALCQRIFALPVHEGLDDAAVDAVIAAAGAVG
jgi:dTDP-4-amino-4,6-dideoxygalactose transaminase